MNALERMAKSLGTDRFFIELDGGVLDAQVKSESQSFAITREGFRYYATEFRGVDSDTNAPTHERELTPRLTLRGMVKQIDNSVKQYADFWAD